MHAFYFAYGSNLASRRMRERVPAARALGRARLAGFRLVADKPGRDGGAKVNIERDPDACVWGAVWELREAELRELDRFEGGYERIPALVGCDAGPLAAVTYSSRLRGAPAGLERGYKALILEGAREHGLPPGWIAFLEALPER